MIYFSDFYWGQNFTFLLYELRLAKFRMLLLMVVPFSRVQFDFAIGLISLYFYFFLSLRSICCVCQWILSDFDGIEGYRSKTTKVPRNFTLYGVFLVPFFSLIMCHFEIPFGWNNGKELSVHIIWAFHSLMVRMLLNFLTYFVKEIGQVGYYSKAPH